LVTTLRSIEHNARTGFASLSPGGLRMDSFSMTLFRKGNKKFWNPDSIDFGTDAEQFAAMTDLEQRSVCVSAAQFMAGEESVTQDIQPFMQVMAAEGRLDDEAYLTQFAFEEAKHMQGFRLWFDAVGMHGDLHEYTEHSPAYGEIFKVIQPDAMYALLDDPSPAAQIRASVVYNHIVEGTLARTGYYNWNKLFTSRNVFPGMQQLIKYISDDERRHMAWGTFTCRRHVAADDANWNVVQQCVDELRQPAIDLLTAYVRRLEAEGQKSPFGSTSDELADYANERLDRRLASIEGARGRSLQEIDCDHSPIELEDQLMAKGG